MNNPPTLTHPHSHPNSNPNPDPDPDPNPNPNPNPERNPNPDSNNHPNQAHGGETIDFPPASFDTVVTINVLEHCEDAFEYMHRMHRVLKPGGLLIFHERVYDNFWKVLDPVTHSSEVAGWHPLRVKRKLVDTLLKHYEVQLYSVDLTREMVKRKRTQIAEEPLWIIARKINATHP